ncbi:MAG: MBL fold metallo-hydrolase, partial [Mycobacteriales bacterium]
MNPDDWTAAGVFEVAAGVYRIPLPLPNDGLRAVNVYAIATADGFTLVDGGWAIPQAQQRLEEAIGELGASLADVHRILVTHVHRDHYTQAIEIRRQFGARVGLGSGERPTLQLLKDEHRRPLNTQMERLRRLGAGEIADKIEASIGPTQLPSAHWELPDDWLGEEQIMLPGGRSLQALPTPGHTAGHLVFHDIEHCLLFAGDHVLPTITPSIGFEPVPSANPLGAFLASLRLVRARPDAMLLPAHGPVTKGTHARVEELIDHHGLRLAQTERAVADGAHTAYDVAARLSWTKRERSLAELDLFNTMLATFETAAHLDL